MKTLTAYDVLVHTGLGRSLISSSDDDVASILTERCGITITTPEAEAVVLELVERIHDDFLDGTLCGLDSEELEGYLGEIAQEVAPAPEHERYFAALGLHKDCVCHTRLPTDQKGEVFAWEEGPDAEVDVDACAWRWVAYVVLVLANHMVKYVLELGEDCGCPVEHVVDPDHVCDDSCDE